MEQGISIFLCQFNASLINDYFFFSKYNAFLLLFSFYLYFFHNFFPFQLFPDASSSQASFIYLTVIFLLLQTRILSINCRNKPTGFIPLDLPLLSFSHIFKHLSSGCNTFRAYLQWEWRIWSKGQKSLWANAFIIWILNTNI